MFHRLISNRKSGDFLERPAVSITGSRDQGVGDYRSGT